jgi:hypothetical protein
MPLDELANLADLISLCEAANGLQVEDLGDAYPRENVMAAANAFIEAETDQDQ